MKRMRILLDLLNKLNEENPKCREFNEMMKEKIKEKFGE